MVVRGHGKVGGHDRAPLDLNGRSEARLEVVSEQTRAGCCSVDCGQSLGSTLKDHVAETLDCRRCDLVHGVEDAFHRCESFGKISGDRYYCEDSLARVVGTACGMEVVRAEEIEEELVNMFDAEAATDRGSQCREAVGAPEKGGSLESVSQVWLSVLGALVVMSDERISVTPLERRAQSDAEAEIYRVHGDDNSRRRGSAGLHLVSMSRLFDLRICSGQVRLGVCCKEAIVVCGRTETYHDGEEANVLLWVTESTSSLSAVVILDGFLFSESSLWERGTLVCLCSHHRGLCLHREGF